MGHQIRAIDATPVAVASTVVTFPRATTLHADLDRPAILRRCRIAGRHAGLGSDGVAMVEAHAAGMLEGNAAPREVVAAAERYAARLAAPHAGDDTPGAA